MMQDYLVEWMNWYYGNGPYPLTLGSQMTHDERMEALSKTEQIKKIVGKPKDVRTYINGSVTPEYGPGMFIDDDEWEKEMGR
jgi:hypothetical protein